MADLERDGIGQRVALIRHWLRAEPAEDMDAFVVQAAEAQWIEKRHYESLGKLLREEKKR